MYKLITSSLNYAVQDRIIQIKPNQTSQSVSLSIHPSPSLH